MQLFQKRNPKNLDEWLGIATKKLVPSAKERIQSEIEAHYAEAVAHHLAEGASEADARAAALGELGDAKVAAKNFGRKHLTEWESKRLEQTLKYARRDPTLKWSYWIFVLYLWHIFSEHDRYRFPTALLVVGVFALVVIPTISYRSAKNMRASPSVFLLSWYSTEGIGIFVILQFFCLRHSETTLHALSIVCVLALLGASIPSFRIWRKMRSMGDGWSEIPTGDAS